MCLFSCIANYFKRRKLKNRIKQLQNENKRLKSVIVNLIKKNSALTVDCEILKHPFNYQNDLTWPAYDVLIREESV